jgi:FkbM family methyltransferase
MKTLSESHQRSTSADAVNGYVKQVLKGLRSSQPLNYLATGMVHALQTVTGVRSELVVKHLHKVGMVRRELPNGRTLRLWSRADDWVSNQVYWRGWSGYEPETVPLFFRLAARAQVILDIGAYVGFFALVAGHANPNARVYAFEPMPTVYERLRKNVAINQLSNVQCIRCAAGDTECTAEFYSTGSEMQCSSSLSLDFMQGAEDLYSFPVEVVPLDRFVRDNNLDPVDLIKIDTETTEPEVLSGMAETLARDHPMIVCEVLKDRGAENRLEAILSPLGYRYYQLTPDGPDLRDHVEGHPEWLNYLFTTLDSQEVALL